MNRLQGRLLRDWGFSVFVGASLAREVLVGRDESPAGQAPTGLVRSLFVVGCWCCRGPLRRPILVGTGWRSFGRAAEGPPTAGCGGFLQEAAHRPIFAFYLSVPH